MGKPKDLLKKQELTLDNHHPNTPLEWDDEVHFHKNMTVSFGGEKTSISGSFHLTKDRGIGVTFDKGKSHHKIKSAKERKQLETVLKKEIVDAMKDEQEAHAFIKSVIDLVKSFSSGQNEKEVKKRVKQAYDSVMSALGVSTARSVNLANTNGDLLSFYMDSPDGNFDIEYMLYTLMFYQRNYHAYVKDSYQIYYIVYMGGHLSIGEFTPYALLKYRFKGFRISRKGILEAIIAI